MRLLTKSILAATALVAAAQAADVVVQDATITPGMVYNMTKNNTYYLNGFVYIDSGATLNIQAGTVIKGMGNYGMSVSALIICRNAKIHAIGTPTEPIIFTSIADDVNNPDDLGPYARGLWGGVQILGNGRMVSGTSGLPPGMMRIEGLPMDSAISADPRNWAGGTNDNDSSGVLKYVSVRHATPLSMDNELNSITFYGVGSRTVAEHIEIFAGDDDGIEFFGGAVNLKWASVAFCNDDAFDWDNGWDGKGQFWFSISAPTSTFIMGHADRGLEASGTAKVDHNDTIKGSDPTLYNFTFIGMGKNAVMPSTHSNAIRFNEDSRGKIHNGIVMDFPRRAIQFATSYTSGDSRKHFWDDSLQVTNCFFHDFGAGSTWNTICNNTDTTTLIKLASNNWIKNPMIRGTSREAGLPFLDPRPNAIGSPACSSQYVRAVPSDPFFTPVSWVGCFNKTSSNLDWLQGWSALSANKILAKHLQITPAKYICSRTGIDMDLSFILNVPPTEAGVESTSACTVYVDGTNVSSSFVARATSMNMSNGNGVTYRINDLTAWELGTTGVHTIRAAIPLSNGWVVRDTAKIVMY